MISSPLSRSNLNVKLCSYSTDSMFQALEWCQSKDIVDIAGPAVASALSLWELLLLRVDCVKRDSQVAALYEELQQLLSKLRQMAHRLFRPLDHPLPPGTKHVTVQVSLERLGEI